MFHVLGVTFSADMIRIRIRIRINFICPNSKKHK